jgi:hypothetical protein
MSFDPLVRELTHNVHFWLECWMQLGFIHLILFRFTHNVIRVWIKVLLMEVYLGEHGRLWFGLIEMLTIRSSVCSFLSEVSLTQTTCRWLNRFWSCVWFGFKYALWILNNSLNISFIMRIVVLVELVQLVLVRCLDQRCCCSVLG